MLINPQELADLQEALALADFRTEQASGTMRMMPDEEVRARPGLSHG